MSTHPTPRMSSATWSCGTTPARCTGPFPTTEPEGAAAPDHVARRRTDLLMGSEVVTPTAMHGVRLNVANLDRAQQFYTGLGMVEDIGMRRDAQPSGLTSVLADNDPARNSHARSVALRWPSDPYMHVNLVACDPSGPRQGWPKSVDQLGSTVLTLLVPDLDAEMRRLIDDRADGLRRSGCDYRTGEWLHAIRLRRGSGWKRRRAARIASRTEVGTTRPARWPEHRRPSSTSNSTRTTSARCRSSMPVSDSSRTP